MEFGEQVVVADFEAGIGTLTRLGDQPVDVIILVVEPSAKSLDVGGRAVGLATEKALGRVVVVANRIRDDADLETVRRALPGAEIVAVPDDPAIADAERRGVAPLDAAPDAPAVRALVDLGVSLAKL